MDISHGSLSNKPSFQDAPCIGLAEFLIKALVGRYIFEMYLLLCGKALKAGQNLQIKKDFDDYSNIISDSFYEAVLMMGYNNVLSKNRKIMSWFYHQKPFLAQLSL